MKKRQRERLTSGVWAAALEEEDKLARNLVDEAVEALGAGVASVQNVVDVDAVVVGGGLGTRLGQPYVERIAVAAEPHLFVDDRPPAFVLTALGDNGGALGAAPPSRPDARSRASRGSPPPPRDCPSRASRSSSPARGPCSAGRSARSRRAARRDVVDVADALERRVGERHAEQLLVRAFLVVMWKTPIARTRMRQPGNVGSATSTSASSGSPSSASVPSMKP